jgi:hypothetical protein
MSAEGLFRINSFTSAAIESEAEPLYWTKTQEILEDACILHQGTSSARLYACLRKSLLFEMPSCCEVSEVCFNFGTFPNCSLYVSQSAPRKMHAKGLQGI